MKKTILIAVVAILCSLSVYAQDPVVRLTSANGKHLRTLTDGVPVRISWENPGASIATVARVVVECLSGDEVVWTEGLDYERTLPTSSMLWVPRTRYLAYETVRIRVDWYQTMLVDSRPTQTAYSERYALSSKPKSLELRANIDFAINGYPVITFTWTSQNIPAGSHIIILAESTTDPNLGMVLAYTCDNGGYRYWMGDPIPRPDTYNVNAYYVNEYGAWGLRSNPIRLEVTTGAAVPFASSDQTASEDFKTTQFTMAPLSPSNLLQARVLGN